MKKLAVLLNSLFFIHYCLLAQNVGIGTTTPEGVLHLKGTNWTKTILENNTGEPRGYIGADNNGTITLASNAYWNGSAWVYPNTGPSMYMLFHRPNQQFEFRVRPDGGAQSTPMVIEVGGNVGIGTTAPQQNLGVGGGVVIDQNNNNTGSSLNILSFGSLSGEGIGSKRNAGGNQSGLDFYTNNAARMSITNNGNVGIGTSSPLTKLHVDGSIKIGNSTANEEGSIRFNNNRFEGYTGTSWKGFEQVSVSSVITSRIVNDGVLLGQGYKYIGAIPGVITRDTVTANVAANTWLPASVALNYPPPPLYGESVVWTGNHLIVWGGAEGHHENDDPQTPFLTTYAEGYYFDFDSNTWDTIKRLPEARYLHSTVWTGTEMIAWGGRRSNADGSFTVFSNGAKLNGNSFIWTNISGPSARYNHTAVWTGTEMIVWGGQSSNNITSVLNSGSRYNPATNTWSTVSTVNAPTARTEHTAVWAGGKMVVWGGKNASGVYVNTGAVYDPVTDTWTPMSSVNVPFAGYGYASLANGNSMLVWGGTIGNTSLGYNYNVTTNTWSSYTPGNSITNRMYPALIIANGNTILFGGYPVGSETILNEAFRNNVPIHPPAYTAAAATHLFWTGDFLIAFGGFGPVGSNKTGTNRCTRLFLSAQSVTSINETTRKLFLYQKN